MTSLCLVYRLHWLPLQHEDHPPFDSFDPPGRLHRLAFSSCRNVQATTVLLGIPHSSSLSRKHRHRYRTCVPLDAFPYILFEAYFEPLNLCLSYALNYRHSDRNLRLHRVCLVSVMLWRRRLRDRRSTTLHELREYKVNLVGAILPTESTRRSFRPADYVFGEEPCKHLSIRLAPQSLGSSYTPYRQTASLRS
jgi:hypothetical protein